MSHFALLVVTPEEPTDDVLGRTLQPFHEFECTGKDDQFVVDVDKTEEFLADYNTDTKSMLRAPDGALIDRYDDQFYRDPTADERESIGPIAGTGSGNGLSWASKDWGDGRGYRTKIHFIPDGYAEEDVPIKCVMTLREFAEYRGTAVAEQGAPLDLTGPHKHGYALMNIENLVKVIDRTNPNKQWDWWQVGGRYSKRLRSLETKAAVDHARKGTVDWAAMAQAKSRSRRDAIEEALVKVGNRTGRTRDELLAIHAAASKAWPAVDAEWSALDSKPNRWEWLNMLPVEHPVRVARDLKLWHSFDGLISEYGAGVPEEAADPFEWANTGAPLTAFAFLRDGHWAERGSMGWCGCVSDEQDDWDAQFSKLLADVPDDHWLTIVCCHI